MFELIIILRPVLWTGSTDYWKDPQKKDLLKNQTSLRPS